MSKQTLAARVTNGRDVEYYDHDSGNTVLAFRQPNGSLPCFGVTDAITAHSGGGQASAVALTTTINRVTTVAAAADSVALPAAKAGLFCVVSNMAALNSMNVFPATGDAINALSANAAFAVAADKTAVFFSPADGIWVAILTA